MRNTIQNTENRKVEKSRNFLTAEEVNRLIAQAEAGRYPTRDKALILMAFRHGLRASEAVSIKWDQIDLNAARIQVQRLKGSDDSIHVLEADEVRLLRKLKKETNSAFVFMTERGTPMSADGFLKLFKALGKAAGFTFNVHPHMLRHGAGHALAMNNASTRSIQSFLGHRNIQHTVRYTQMNDAAFKGFGKLIGGKVK